MLTNNWGWGRGTERKCKHTSALEGNFATANVLSIQSEKAARTEETTELQVDWNSLKDPRFYCHSFVAGSVELKRFHEQKKRFEKDTLRTRIQQTKGVRNSSLFLINSHPHLLWALDAAATLDNVVAGRLIQSPPNNEILFCEFRSAFLRWSRWRRTTRSCST